MRTVLFIEEPEALSLRGLGRNFCLGQILRDTLVAGALSDFHQFDGRGGHQSKSHKSHKDGSQENDNLCSELHLMSPSSVFLHLTCIDEGDHRKVSCPEQAAPYSEAAAPAVDNKNFVFLLY